MNNNYEVEIELGNITFNIMAKNVVEARRKALGKLRKKNPVSLIKRSWPDNKREIYITER